MCSAAGCDCLEAPLGHRGERTELLGRWWSSCTRRRCPTALEATGAAASVVTSNKPFGTWGRGLRRRIVAAAMIYCLVHHSEVISLKGDSYRLLDRDLGRATAATTEDA